jgi:tetratricopeptide (TPR) repeat protein
MNTARRTAAPPPDRDTRRLLIVGGAIALVAGLLLVAIALPSRRASSAPPPAPAVPDRDAADEAIERLERFAASADPEAVLLKCDEARGALQAGRHGGRFRAVEERARLLKNQRDGERKLDAFLINARDIARSDPAFTRRAEILEMCRSALAIARDRRWEVEKFHADYDRGFDEAARAAVAAARAEAEPLAAGRSYDEAIARLDALPAAYRETRHAESLVPFRREWDRLREEAKKSARGWQELFEAAGELIVKPDYPAAKKIYLEALPIAPAEPPAGAARNLYITGLYNFACIRSVESKDLDGDQKKSARDEAFKYLEWALRSGYGKRRCRCHPEGDGFLHIEKDGDIDPIRADPRYAEVMKKHRK